MFTGSFEGLNSTYDAKREGVWLGFDLVWEISEGLDFSGTFEYYWADYEGEADWNLRDDFAHPVSFRHDADGTGTVISICLKYFFIIIGP